MVDVRKSSRYDVICVGSTTIDKFITIKDNFSDLKPGSKLLIDREEMHFGGGAGNSSCALSKLGLNVSIISKISKDHYGKLIEQDLFEQGVKNLVKIKSNKPSDKSILISSKQDKDRIIIEHKGSSLDLNQKDVFYSKLKKTRWIYLATLMGKSESVGKEIAKFANKNKIKVLFNPSLYLAKQGSSKLRHFLKASKIIILNKEEAQALLKDKRSKVENLLKKISHFGPEITIITNGKKGITAFDGINFYSAETITEFKVVNTAGAGDAFNSGFLFGIIEKDYFNHNKNKGLKEEVIKYAIKLGQANASSVIQHIGTKNKLLTKKQALSFIRRHEVKVRKWKDK